MNFLFCLLMIVAAPSNADQPLETTVTVRPTDMDQKGHVNNARHVEYFQEGRWAWLQSKGASNDDLERESHTQLVVVNLNINYKRPLKYGQSPRLFTRAAQKSEKVVVFYQEIRLNDEVVVDGVVTMVATDATTHKSKPVPEMLKRVLGQ